MHKNWRGLEKRIGMEDIYWGWNMHLYVVTEEEYNLIGTENIWHSRICIPNTELCLRNNWDRIISIKLCIYKITRFQGLKKKEYH